MGTGLRFGILDSPRAPYPTLIERWRLIEDLGFDYLWIPDHTADYQNPSGPWQDGWVTLAAAAANTQRIRIGTLVTNPILRHPVIAAKQVASLDHLSDGRMELGIGTGIAQFDFEAVGVERWSIGERTERYAEYVQIIDQLLRTADEPISVEGRYYQTVGSRISPPTPQRPRPPITVGGQSLAVLRVAVAQADCWNSDGHPDRSVEEIYATTRDQTQVLDDLCHSADRDPHSLRRSLLLIHQLDAWAKSDSLERMVKLFCELGIQEYSMFWPGDDRLVDVRRAAEEVIPRLRRELG